MSVILPTQTNQYTCYYSNISFHRYLHLRVHCGDARAHWLQDTFTRVPQYQVPRATWAPDSCASGPNFPPWKSGKFGPGQLGPRVRLSGAQLSALKKWQIGPQTVGPQGPTVQGPIVRGKLGPGQLGPGARLSGAQLSALKKWQIGPRTVGPRKCTIPKTKKSSKNKAHNTKYKHGCSKI